MTHCPHCNGFGIVTVIWRGLPESAADAADCACCGGRGKIPEAQAARLEAGRAMRRDRIARGVSLREEAHRRGIDPRALSEMEWGRA